jgi:hypothetical protein
LIRISVPEDSDDISRLALAQYQQTPWTLDGVLPPVTAFHVCERQGRIAACCGYQRNGSTLLIVHVWAEFGFGGKRAAVELMKDLEGMADAEGRDLIFDTAPTNIGLQKAVEEHGCEPILDRWPRAVTYRRKARI